MLRQNWRKSGAAFRIASAGSIIGGIFLLAGCAAGQTSSSPAAPPKPAPEPDEKDGVAEMPPVEADSPDDAGVPEETSPQENPVDVVRELCELNCQKADAVCTASTAEFCRASCRDYVSGAEDCPVEIAEALRCQNTAADFEICSNIAAASCSELYRDLEACRTGKSPPRVWGQRVEASHEDGLPSGWEMLEEANFGFSSLMPQGFTLEKTEDGFKSSGSAPDGGSYATVGYRLKSKPSDIQVMNIAIAYVGKGCGEDLRMHGRFESKGVTHVRFDAPCESGGGYRGFLHQWGQQLVLTAGKFKKISFGEELSPSLERFLFSFEPAAK